MSKILHLFRLEKFTKAYILFINENFPNDYHEFWIYGDREQKLDLPARRNVKRPRNMYYVKLKSGRIYQFDKIIYHGVFEQPIIDFFARNRKLLDRLYLYFWGGDKFYVEDRWANLRKKYVIRNAHGIITIIPEEQQYLKKYYHFKGTPFCAMYCSATIMRNLRRFSGGKVANSVTKILLGNSATPSMNHIAILRKLSKFKDENIEIYVPLSYGIGSYAQQVIVEGTGIFGKKFIPIMDFMKEDDYYEFLNRMDIGIFDMNRQQAMGNIFALLTFGKKIYLHAHSVLAHYLRVENHCDIWTTNEIEVMTLADFAAFSQDSAEKNIEAIRRICLEESCIKAWEKIFNEN